MSALGQDLLRKFQSYFPNVCTLVCFVRHTTYMLVYRKHCLVDTYCACFAMRYIQRSIFDEWSLKIRKHLGVSLDELAVHSIATDADDEVE